MLKTASDRRERAQAQAPDATPQDCAAARAMDRPLDRALYSCRCGLVFDADVSANVRCPACHGEQPW